MLNSSILECQDPAEYQSAISGAEDLKCVITARGDYRAELTLIGLHQLELQRGSISLPRIVNSAHTGDQWSFCFPTADQPPTLFNGAEVPQHSMAFYCPGAEYFVRASGECFWGGISVSPEVLTAASRALLGVEIEAPKATQLFCPPQPLLARLLKLHEAAARLAATTPDILSHPEVAGAIEQEMLRALIACIVDSQVAGDRYRSAQTIMRRFQETIETRAGEPIYLMDVCAAIGVSERTLHRVCTEYLGMGPHRYLWLRRMNAARQALVRANPASATVTAVANDYGFGELGRFAVAYRTLFGESPSTTLRARSIRYLGA
jgi:AraC-like DNA-binding protein